MHQPKFSSEELNKHFTMAKQLSDEGKLVRISAVERTTKDSVILNIFKSDFVRGYNDHFNHFLARLDQLTKLQSQLINPVKIVGGDFYVVQKPTLQSLRSIIDRGGPIPIDRAIKIIKSVAGTLASTHAAGMVHYNLKAENIYVTADNQAILDNFQFLNPAGLSHSHHTPTTSANYAYLSPESCDVSEMDARVDIWAMGVILFEMIAGKPPFYHDNPLRLMLAIMRQPVPDIQRINPNVPNGVADLIYRLLTKDKNQRIPTMQLVFEILEHIDKQLEINDPSEFPFFTNLVVRRDTTLPMVGPLYGRQQEQQTIRTELFNNDARLVSLIGPGGMGKTHLAIATGQALKDEFEHGVVYADFEEVDDSHLAVATITNSLNFRTFGREDALTQLQKFLQNKKLLLILDNVVYADTVGPIVESLLEHTHHVKFLTTSHDPLQIEQTVSVSIQGLDTSSSNLNASEQSPASELFIAIARRQQYDYTPSSRELPVIHDICHMVGGVPLAIELAASRIHQLSAEEIFIELIGDLAVLDSNSDDIPEKHRSIRTLYEQSWRQLSQEERDILKKLSVFVGGVHYEAIQEVTGASSATINRLVNKSLLNRSTDDGLYYLQPLLRKLATERLTTNPNLKLATRSRHSRYYLMSLSRLIPSLRGGKQLDALQRIDENYGNLRKAAQWALAMYDLDLIDTWIEAMHLYFMMRGRQNEGFKIFTDIGRQIDFIFNEDPNIFALKAQLSRLALARYVNHSLDLKLELTNNLAIARELKRPDEIVFALVQLCAQPISNEDRMAYCIEAIDIGLQIDRQDLITQAYNWLAFILFQKSLFMDALILLEQCLQLQRELGDYFGISKSLNNQGIIYNVNGEMEKARELLLEAVDLCELFNNRIATAQAYTNLSENAVYLKDIPTALSFNQKAISIFEHLGDPVHHIKALVNRANIAFLADDLEKVEETCQQGLLLCDANNLPESKYDFYNLLGRKALLVSNTKSAQSFLVKALSNRNDQQIQLETLAEFAELFAITQNIILAFQVSTFVQKNTNSTKLKDKVNKILESLRGSMRKTQNFVEFNSLDECRSTVIAAVQ